MNKKLLIDLNQYRECGKLNCDHRVPQGFLSEYPETNGQKHLRELAVFASSCRRCEDAPCIEVCPEEALNKDDNGMIVRSTHLCVACKSCVSICPFGTMMSDFYEYIRDRSNYYNLKEEKQLEEFIRKSPEGSVQIIESEQEIENEDVYELLPGILIKDHSWEKLKKIK